jgi:hypothetical protein
MQRHHSNRRQPYHQLDKQHQQHLQPRQRSRHLRHSRAGYNDQPTQRRRGAAGKRSTTGTIKRNSDQDSKTNTSQRLTSTHAEQSLKVSDSPLAIAHQMKNSLSYRILRISDTEKAVQPPYLYDPDKDDRDLHLDHMEYDPPQRSSEWAPRPYVTLWQRSYTNIIPMMRDNAVANATQPITSTRTTNT